MANAPLPQLSSRLSHACPVLGLNENKDYQALTLLNTCSVGRCPHCVLVGKQVRLLYYGTEEETEARRLHDGLRSPFLRGRAKVRIQET